MTRILLCMALAAVTLGCTGSEAVSDKESMTKVEGLKSEPMKPKSGTVPKSGNPPPGG